MGTARKIYGGSQLIIECPAKLQRVGRSGARAVAIQERHEAHNISRAATCKPDRILKVGLQIELGELPVRRVVKCCAHGRRT